MRLSPQAGRIGILGPGRVGLSRTPPQASAPSGDEHFASVVLLLDFAGADAATDITDLSSSAKTETFAGVAEVDTGIQYLGVNSLLCGATGYITYVDHADWDFPADFTIELGIYMPAADTSRGVISSYGAAEGWAFQTGDGTGADIDLNFIAMGAEQISRQVTVDHETWYHIAIVRDGSNLRVFLDGVQQGAAASYATSITGGNVLALGLLQPAALQRWQGSIGAVRITKGVARYTSNFTPPSVFYPTSV